MNKSVLNLDKTIIKKRFFYVFNEKLLDFTSTYSI